MSRMVLFPFKLSEASSAKGVEIEMTGSVLGVVSRPSPTNVHDEEHFLVAQVYGSVDPTTTRRFKLLTIQDLLDGLSTGYAMHGRVGRTSFFMQELPLEQTAAQLELETEGLSEEEVALNAQASSAPTEPPPAPPPEAASSEPLSPPVEAPPSQAPVEVVPPPAPPAEGNGAPSPDAPPQT